MTDPADLVLKNAEVHTLAPDGDGTHEAVAVRDGRILRVGDDYEMQFLEGIETRVIDLGGRVLLPGFVDAHTHVENSGQYLVHADLSAAGSVEEAVERLRSGARDDREWILGYGYDESTWPEDRYLTREDLDRVSTERPVAAVRVDMHTASLNSVAVERLRPEMPDDEVHTEGGEPTGVVVEDAVGALREATAPGYRETRQLVTAAIDRATDLGVTGVHDLVRDSHAPRVYRDLAAEGELDVRVRVNYWSDHFEAAVETGLRTNGGGDMVRVGGIKTFTDGSIGARTAKLFEPYEDADGAGTGAADGGDGNGKSEGADGDEGGPTGQWVVDPEELRGIVDRAHAEGFQVCTHAIGDEAIEAALSAYEAVLADGSAGSGDPTGSADAAAGNPGGEAATEEAPVSGVADDPRHRIEHVELATDNQIERMAAAGVVASVQPNFLQWADEGGLYDRRLGRTRRENSNRYRDLLDAGVDLAFGSDCMPLDPLLGVEYAVNAPVEAQRLSVTEALRAYTLGSARAGFDEDRLGTVEVGKHADLVALDRSPWEHPGEIADVDVALTVVEGRIVADGR